MRSFTAAMPQVTPTDLQLGWDGTLEEQQADALIAWSEALIGKLNANYGMRKRAVRCVIEMVQNVSKHQGAGRFEMFHANDLLVLRTRNHVSDAEKPHLEQALSDAFSPPLEQVREAVKTKLVEGARTPSGGAGLGFMDLRSCAEDNLCVEFIPCGQETSTFVLCVWFHI